MTIQLPLAVWPSVQQTAALTGTSEKTVRRRIADGTLKARRFGPRLIRIDPTSLESFGSPMQDGGESA